MKAHLPPSLPLSTIRWEQLIELIGRANRALAHYDGILHGVPNPSVLLAPLTTQEAVLSSKIEGTQATLGEVLKYEAGDIQTSEPKRLDIQEIINYRKALRLAEAGLKRRPFHLNQLLQLHGVLLDSVRGRGKARGQFRRTQNWIGLPGSPIEEAHFVPPDAMDLPGLLDNWEKYYHFEERDPLVQLAVIHAQFEIIHPFLDGNGRLGRILIPLFLCEKGVLSRPFFYLSAYLEKNRVEYVSRLRALNDPAAWTDWIAFFLKALIAQAQSNATTARKMLALYEDIKLRAVDATRSRYAVLLVDRLFEHPIFRPSQIRLKGKGPSRQMIQRLLIQMKTSGILKVLREGSGRRAQVLALHELINLCEGRRVI